MNSRTPWAALRNDYLILLSSAVVLVPLISGRSIWLVPLGLAGAIFSGVSPRMIGRFDLKGAGIWISGSFQRADSSLKGGFNRRDRDSPGSRDPESSREPREG